MVTIGKLWSYTFMDIIKGFTQEEFAFKCGLHRTYISAIERYIRSISLGNIQKIADALEIETYMLFIQNDSDDIDD